MKLVIVWIAAFIGSNLLMSVYRANYRAGVVSCLFYFFFLGLAAVILIAEDDK